MAQGTVVHIDLPHIEGLKKITSHNNYNDLIRYYYIFSTTTDIFCCLKRFRTIFPKPLILIILNIRYYYYLNYYNYAGCNFLRKKYEYIFKWWIHLYSLIYRLDKEVNELFIAILVNKIKLLEMKESELAFTLGYLLWEQTSFFSTLNFLN